MKTDGIHMNELMQANDALACLLNAVESAISSGDWKVDGTCDPDMVINCAQHVLMANGYHRNGISGEWQRAI